MSSLQDRILHWLKSQPSRIYTLEEITNGIRHSNKESVRKKLLLLRKKGLVGYKRPKMYFLLEKNIEKKRGVPNQVYPPKGVPNASGVRDLGVLPWLSERGRYHNVRVIGYGVPGVNGQGKRVVNLSHLHKSARAILFFHGNGTFEAFFECKRPGFTGGKTGTLKEAFGIVRSVLGLIAGDLAFDEWPNFIVERFEVRNSRKVVYTGVNVLVEVFAGKVFLHAYKDVDEDGNPTLETEVWFRGMEVSLEDVLASAYVTRDYMRAMHHIEEVKKQTIAYLANAMLRDQELLENTGRLRIIAESLGVRANETNQRLLQVLNGLDHIESSLEVQTSLLAQTTSTQERIASVLDRTSEIHGVMTSILSRIEHRSNEILEIVQSSRDKILSYLNTHGTSTIQEIMVHTGLSYMVVWRELKNLVRSGIVVEERMRNGRGRPRGIYRIRD